MRLWQLSGYSPIQSTLVWAQGSTDTARAVVRSEARRRPGLERARATEAVGNKAKHLQLEEGTIWADGEEGPSADRG